MAAPTLQESVHGRQAATDLGTWAEPIAQLVREAGALQASSPERSALMLAAAARIVFDICGDGATAQELLAQGATVAPDSRPVAASQLWLALCQGRLSDVVRHARVELDAAASPRERVDLLGRMAALEELVAGNVDAAERWLKEAVALAPEDLSSSVALAGVFGRTKRWAEAAEAWERLAEHIVDSAPRACWYAAVGSLREAHLGDMPAARAAWQRAVEADSREVAARASLEPVLQRGQAWAEYARILVAQAEQLTEDPATARLFFERAGDVLWETGHGPEEAAVCYERAVASAPDQLVPMHKLASVLEAKGDTGRLEQLYDRILQLAFDPVERASCCYRLGTLLEKVGQQPERALAAYRAALEALPTFVAAAEALETLCVRLDRWDSLVELLHGEAERVVSPVQRAAKYARIADIYRHKLARSNDAASMCEQALALDPEQATATDLLERILRDHGDTAGLAAMVERTVATTKDERMARALRIELASLHLLRGRADLAVPLLRGALTGQQDDLPTLRLLERSLRDSAQWQDLVSVLESQARLLSAGSSRVYALLRVALLIEMRLEDPRRALAAYQQVLDIDPQHEEALEGMLRVCVGQSRWEEAVALERKLAALTTRPEDSAGRLYRAGSILENRLGRLDEAAHAYEEAVAKLPSYVPASLALERVLRATQKHAQLAEMFDRRAAAETDPERCALAWVAAATVRELRLGDMRRALDGLDHALAHRPGFLPALWGKLRIHQVLADWQACESDLEALLQATPHACTRSGLLVRKARLCEMRLHDLSRAGSVLEEAIACGYHQRFVVVDRFRIAQMEVPNASSLRWWSEAASATTDRNWAAALLRQRMFALLFTDTELRSVEDACSRTLAYRETDAQAAEGLASVLARRDERRGLVPVLVRQARQIAHGPTCALHWFVAGVGAENQGDGAQALDLYGEALQVESNMIGALEGLRRLCVLSGDWNGVLHACQRVADAAGDPTNAATALLEAGDTCLTRLGDASAALEMYRAVLAKQPAHGAAFERAAGVLAQSNDWQTLAGMLAEHRAATQDDARQLELSERLATVLSARLGRIKEATAELEKAVRTLPNTTSLYPLLGELYERDGQWQNAIQTYERLASLAHDPKSREDAMLRVASILSAQLGEHQRARDILEPLVAELAGAAPRHALQQLAQVYAKLGDAKPARDLCRKLGEVGTPEERTESLVLAAEISERRIGDREGGQQAIEQALEIAAMHPSVLGAIEGLFERMNAWQRYVALADRIAERAPPHASGALALRMSVARAYADKLYAPGVADLHLRATAERFPGAAEPRVMLGLGLVGNNETAALTELRTAVQLDPFCADAHRGLKTLCDRQGRIGCSSYAASAFTLLNTEGPVIPSLPSFEVIPNSLLPEDALALLVGPTRSRTTRRLAAILDPHLHQIFPPNPDRVASLTRLPDTYPVATGLRSLAAAFGARPVVPYRGAGQTVGMVLTEPRGIVLGTDMLGGPALARGMFEACRDIAALAAGSAMLRAVERERFIGLLLAATGADSGADLDPELRKHLASVLPRRARKDLERVLEEERTDLRTDIQAWELEEQSRLLRIAVVFTRDLRAVAQALVPQALSAPSAEERRRLLAGSDSMREALQFSATDACWSAHQRLFGQV